METLDDASNFNAMKKALSVVEFSSKEQEALFFIVASVIHLGTVSFLEQDNGEVTVENGRPVNIVSKVWQVLLVFICLEG